MDVIHLAANATEADIVKAIADLPRGGTIVLPENRTIAIRSGLDIDLTDRSITLDLNGSTLRRAGDVSVITGRGEHDDPASVKLGSDATGNTVAAYAKAPAGLAAGDWLKIVSDDRLPGDHLDGNLPSRMGQAMEVLRVQGNVVTFKGALIDQSSYDTNIRASTYASGSLVVKNGEIAGDQTHPSWDLPLVQLRTLIDPRLENLIVRDSVGRGIGVVDCVDAEISNVSVKNLLDGGMATLAIAVSSLSSSGTTVRGLYAENVTHAADDNAMSVAANSVHVEHFGGDIGMNVSDSVAIGTRNFAWSWHSEAVNGSFDNVMAFDSYGFLMARGIGGEVTQSGGAGNQRGVMLYEYGDKDGRDITLDDINLRELLQYSVFASGDTLRNVISNSLLESYGPGNLASAIQVKITDTTFTRAAANPDDVLTGTADNDMLLGGKGSDVISAGAGNDFLWGGAGEDTLTGGYGRDRFAVHSPNDGPDRITDFTPGSGGDMLDLSVIAAHNDWNDGNPIADGYLRFVQSGADVLLKVDPNGGGNAFTTLATLEDVQAAKLSSANVLLSLVDNPDPAPIYDAGILRGTTGDDVLRGSAGQDHIVGGDGSDRLHASIGSTVLEGDAGNDMLAGNLGDDLLRGGAGRDWVAGGNGDDRLYGDAGDDTLVGGGGVDRLYGGDGNDVLDGGSGANMFAGNAGYDTASYETAATAVWADILQNANNAGAAAGDRYSSIENLIGSAFDDVLRGNQIGNVLDGGAGDDRLSGGAGADTLLGGTGADWLDGGTWRDVLTGGSGADSFCFASLAQAGDTITDFQTGIDHLVLSGIGFGIDSPADVAFVVGLEANSAAPTILFDREGGQLFWDADGKGADHAILLASLSEPVNFSISDILIG